LDQNCWFGATPATCREVAEHARRINEAGLDQAVILSSDGHLMDGGHRVAKAWMLGMTEVNARQFETDPAPDYVVEDAAND
jgi:hypothetical protein